VTATTVGPEEEHTEVEWASIIRADLASSVRGFILAGQHLIQAKAEIPHGRFESWLQVELRLTKQTADKFMAIGRHSTMAKDSNWSLLPPSWTTLYELSKLDPDLLEAAIRAGRVHPELDGADARALVIEYRTMAASVHFDLRHGDFRTVFDDLVHGSIDVVLTDPPYAAEFLPLYDDLAEHATRWLKPGGLCAVMCGQSYLPVVIASLVRHLTYHWTIAYLTPGGQSVQVFPRKVNAFWKPVLLFCNGDEPHGVEWFGDVARSDVNDNDKRFHEWGQSESGMTDLLKRVSQPGQTIFDPFAGAATTGVAALANGRSFIGCDVDEATVTRARERLEATVLERLS
jgi:site-specific DNA-methyltransferase (adenine-specific)